MKAKDIKVGAKIKATPWMQEAVEGVVTKIERQGNSGRCTITFHLEGYREAFSFRGSASVKVVKEKTKTSLSLADLKRIAIAKHGEDRAWSLAKLHGNPNHKKSWQAVIDHPVRTPEEALKHQLWQAKIKEDLR